MVLFDAFPVNVRHSACDEVADWYEGDTDTAPRLRDLVEHDAKGKYYSPRSQRSVRAAVQANQEDLRCAEIMAQLQESFEESFFQHIPIKEVSRDLRPHGEHAVPFKLPPHSCKNVCHTARAAYETQLSPNSLTNLLPEASYRSLILCGVHGPLWSPSPGGSGGW